MVLIDRTVLRTKLQLDLDKADTDVACAYDLSSWSYLTAASAFDITPLGALVMCNRMLGVSEDSMSDVGSTFAEPAAWERFGRVSLRGGFD